MSNATVLPPANLASAPIRASLFDIKCFVPQQNINQNLVHFFLTSVLHCRLDSVRVLTSVDPMRLWPSWERNAIQGVVLVDLAKGSYDSFIFLQNQFWTKHLLMTSNLEPMNLWNIKTISNHWLTLLMRTPTTLLAATAKGCLLALLLWRACGILRILDLTAKEAWKGSIIFDGIPIFTYNLAQVIFVDTPKVVNDQHLKKKTPKCKSTWRPIEGGGCFSRYWQTSLMPTGSSNGIAFTELIGKGILAPWGSSTPIIFKASRSSYSLDLEDLLWYNLKNMLILFMCDFSFLGDTHNQRTTCTTPHMKQVAAASSCWISSYGI